MITDSDIKSVIHQQDRLNSLDGLPGAYVLRPRISTCKICKQKKDLRYEVCLECSFYVDMQKIPNGGLRFWDRRDPRNNWDREKRE